jgi:hypothetical protein
VPDVPRLARAEEFANRRTPVFRDPGANEMFREMGTSDRVAVCEAQDFAEQIRESCRSEASRDKACPFVSCTLLPRDAAAQGSTRRVDIETDDVHAVAAPGGRELDAGNEAGARRRGVDAVERRERVVVRYCERAHAAFMSIGEQGIGIERAVGSVAVGVQIEDHVAGIIRGRRLQQSRAPDV